MHSVMRMRVLKCVLGIVACSMTFAACPDAGAQARDAAAAGPVWTELEEKLRIALSGGNASQVPELLAAGASVRARDASGATALHFAVNFGGDIELIKVIVARGADINAADNEGYTPLLRALRHGHYRHQGKGERLYAVAEFLLSHGASAKATGKDGYLPVRAAMDPVNIPLIRLLVKHGAVFPDDGLYWAVSNEYADLARLMMDVAAPAMLAFKGPGGGSMLHRAAEKPRMLFVMQWLVGRGADINALDNDGVTPFGNAVFYGNIQGMEYLQGIKAAMTMVSVNGQTPLHLAAYGARHDVMQWLIERGSDLKARDKWGSTPLDIAIDTHRFAYYDDNRKQQLVAMLGGTPADIVRGRYANDPLHDAIRKRDLRAAERLLEAGANPNVRDESGHTPLSSAIALNSRLPATPNERAFGAKLLPLLIRYGADSTMRTADSTSKTYDDYARELGIGELLQRANQRYAPRGGKKALY